MSDFFKTNTPSSLEEGKRQKIIPSFPLNSPIVPSNGLAEIGIELELEGRGLPSPGYFETVIGKESKSSWERKQDGSLRNGYEYVLTRPCTDNDVVPLVQGFYNVLKKRGTRLNLSNRCSTHVHLNVENYKINELTSLIALWYVFETSLINWCGVERKTNHFCLSHKDTPQVSDVWERFLSSASLQTGGLKYSALNICTLQTFGSLEFRCMGGADNPSSVINWVKFLRAMQVFSKENYQNPFDIAFSLSERGPEEILQSILKDSPAFCEEIFEANRDHNFNSDCMQGLRSFQKNIFGFPWEESMELINAEYVPDPFAKKSIKQTKTSNRGSRLITPHPRVDLARWAVQRTDPLEDIEIN